MSKEVSDWYDDIMKEACQLGLYTGSPTILNSVSKTKSSKRRKIEIKDVVDENEDLFKTPFTISSISKISPSKVRRQSKQVRFVESSNSFKIKTTEIKYENTNSLDFNGKNKDFSFKIDEEDKYYDFDKLKCQTTIQKDESIGELADQNVSSFRIIDELKEWQQEWKEKAQTENKITPANSISSNTKITLK